LNQASIDLLLGKKLVNVCSVLGQMKSAGVLIVRIAGQLPQPADAARIGRFIGADDDFLPANDIRFPRSALELKAEPRQADLVKGVTEQMPDVGGAIRRFFAGNQHERDHAWLATSMIGMNCPCSSFTPNGYSSHSTPRHPPRPDRRRIVGRENVAGQHIHFARDVNSLERKRARTAMRELLIFIYLRRIANAARDCVLAAAVRIQDDFSQARRARVGAGKRAQSARDRIDIEVHALHRVESRLQFLHSQPQFFEP
jgi:hypothetical protein